MKKLLFLLIVFAGINCQAQVKQLADTQQQIVTNQGKIVGVLQSHQATLESTSLSIEALKDRFEELFFKVDSLEDHIKELENNCLAWKVDSMRYLVPTWGDSLIPEYHKRYKIIPFKEAITKISVWKNGEAWVWRRGIDSVTFK